MRPDRRLALALLLLGACHRGGGKEGDDDRSGGPKKVRCAAAAVRQVSDTIDVRGTVAPLPDRDAQVAPQVAGRITRVLVREGDRVTAGQPVAQVDTSPYADEVSEAQAAVDKARAESVNAESTLKRVRRVVEHGVAARQELDDAEARYATARAGEAQAAAMARPARLHIEPAPGRSPLAGLGRQGMPHPGG